MRDRTTAVLDWISDKAAFSTIFLIVGILVAYLWKLGSILPNLGPAETTATQSLTLHGIYSNPYNAPVKLLQFASQHIGIHGVLGLRIAVAVWGTVMMATFFWLAKEWFGRLIATFGTLIFASTPWIAILARQADGQIMLLTPCILLVCYLWLIRTKQRQNLAWLTFCTAGAVSLYIPGMFWVILAGLIISRKRILTVSKDVKKWKLLGSLLITIALLLPLAISIFNNFSIVRSLLLIPGSFTSVADIGKNIVWASLSIFWQSPQHLYFSIGRWPMLNILQTSLAFLGIFIIWARARRVWYGLSTLVVLSILAAGINHNFAFLLLGAPSIMIFICAGLRYLLTEWRTIFPRNPLARGLSVAILVLLVIAQVYFGLHYTLTAWPHTIATKELYMLK